MVGRPQSSATSGTVYVIPPASLIALTYTTSATSTAGPLSTPSFSTAGGTYSGTQTVAISFPTGSIGCVGINSNPTAPSAGTCGAGGTPYTGPITVSTSETLNAIATQAGRLNSAVASASYTISAPVISNPGPGSSGPGFSIGRGQFTASSFYLNGGAQVTSDGVLQVTDGGYGQARSAWYSTPLSVASFTTDFTFRIPTANADGMTFTIQGQGPAALGGSGGSLGYQGIPRSVAVKFDLYDNGGEGWNSTGVYVNGAAPTVPSIDLSTTGINLHSGDVISAHIVYDGTTLNIILTDTVTGASTTVSVPLNIPALTGSTSAYFGFTGGTGGLSAIQNILTWSYSGSTVSPAATPAFSVAGGTYTATQTVAISTTTSAATIYYTTDGTAPTTSSKVYSGPLTVSASETLEAVAAGGGYTTSPAASASYTISAPVISNPGPGSSGPGFSIGRGQFTASSFYLNGGAQVTSDGVLQVTDGGYGQARSAWYSTPLSVASFTTDFTFRIPTANADGMTFTIQGQGPAALGGSGGSLGYQGIPRSVAVKFDLYDNGGEGWNSTGVYVNGAAPTVPSIDLSTTGINLHSGDVISAHIVYDGTTLNIILTDTVTGASTTVSVPLNIPALTGSTSAYFGFTGGTGGLSAIQNILTWSYSGSTVSPAATPAFSVAGGTYTATQTVAISTTTSAATIYYTTDGTAPTTSSKVYSGPLTVSASETLEAVAAGGGYTTSPAASASYTISAPVISNPGPGSSGPGFSIGRGQFTASSFYLNGGAQVTSDGVLQVTDGGYGQARSAWYSTPLSVASFTTDFTFRIPTANADGMTFTIQGQGPAALGGSGGSLGYQGIPRSVAVKFDLYDNGGEGWNSTGVYVNGAAPTVPSIDLSTTGINLHSGDVISAHIVYDGTTLNIILTDTVTGASTTVSVPVNIPALTGSTSAYFGFTGGTGGLSAIQNILTWSYVQRTR